MGDPDEVKVRLAQDLEESGANYLISRFAFGDLTYEESARSLDLFVQEVMPSLSTIETEQRQIA